MINLYVIDYFNKKSSGLKTYVDQLRNNMVKDKKCSFYFRKGNLL
ncbi:hypothetical protein FM107_16310 [Sphingobacterium sp. JB170]|nr:hypothetical protein FM107_16310 [Sphingobacterium sp. JB170]